MVQIQTSFCVPQFAVSIVRTAEKLGSRNVEADVSDSLAMSKEGANTSAFVVHFPQLRQQMQQKWKNKLHETVTIALRHVNTVTFSMADITHGSSIQL